MEAAMNSSLATTSGVPAGTRPAGPGQGELDYRVLFESNPLPMWVYDIESLRFLAVNDVACACYGYTREEFMAMTLRDIRPEGEVPRLEESVRDTGSPSQSSGPWRHRKRDGTLIDVEVCSHSIVHGGRPARFVCPVDVTHRLVAERALRKTESHFRALVEQSLTGIYLIEGGRMTYGNPKLCQLLGYSAEELATIDLATLFEEDRSIVKDVLKARRAGATEAIVFDCRARTKAGEIVHLCVESKVVQLGSSDVSLGVVHDITPRVRALEALRESERRFRELAANVNEVFFLTDPTMGGCLYVSPAYEQIWGRSCESLYHDLSTWEESIHPQDRERVAAHLRNAVESGAYECEYRIIRADGAVRWIQARAGPIRDESGAVYRMAGVAADVTERREAVLEVRRLTASLELRVAERTAALEAANQELEAFDYSISHDLRAPLRHITAFSAALIEEHGHQLDAQGRDYVERLHRAGGKLDQMVADLLALSTLTRGEAYFAPVDVSALARSVVGELRRSHPDHAVEVVIQPGMSASADRGLLHIALENLIGNAWKFSSRQAAPRIEIGCTGEARDAVFFVRDNGAGFDMAYANKLFAPFRRLHKESEFTGTGIGLATVQRIVRRHGGRIWAQAAVGEGAAFHFTLHPLPAR
jgi:PAS domain S-box-containing protein